MFASLVLTVFFAIAFVSLAHFQSHLVKSSAYCGQYQELVTQPGVYSCQEDCGIKCDSQSFKYYSYVTGSGQCLCSNTDNNPLLNGPSVNCYGIDHHSYHNCRNNQIDGVCGPNSAIFTQPGTFACKEECGFHCACGGFSYFNYVAGTQQCQCLYCCEQVYQQNGAQGYAIDNHTCDLFSNLRA